MRRRQRLEQMPPELRRDAVALIDGNSHSHSLSIHMLVAIGKIIIEETINQSYGFKTSTEMGIKYIIENRRGKSAWKSQSCVRVYINICLRYLYSWRGGGCAVLSAKMDHEIKSDYCTEAIFQRCVPLLSAKRRNMLTEGWMTMPVLFCWGLAFMCAQCQGMVFRLCFIFIFFENNVEDHLRAARHGAKHSQASLKLLILKGNGRHKGIFWRLA